MLKDPDKGRRKNKYWRIHFGKSLIFKRTLVKILSIRSSYRCGPLTLLINVTPFKLSQPLLLTNNTNSALLALQARFTRVDFQRVCHHLNGCPRLRLPKRLRTDLNSVKVGQRSLLGQSWQEHRELGKLLPNATNCTTF